MESGKMILPELTRSQDCDDSVRVSSQFDLQPASAPHQHSAVAGNPLQHDLAEPVVVDAARRWRKRTTSVATASIERILAEQGAEIALVLLPGVQYYTGQAFDIARITAAAHRAESSTDARNHRPAGTTTCSSITIDTTTHLFHLACSCRVRAPNRTETSGPTAGMGTCPGPGGHRGRAGRGTGAMRRTESSPMSDYGRAGT